MRTQVVSHECHHKFAFVTDLCTSRDSDIILEIINWLTPIDTIIISFSDKLKCFIISGLELSGNLLGSSFILYLTLMVIVNSLSFATELLNHVQLLASCIKY